MLEFQSLDLQSLESAISSTLFQLKTTTWSSLLAIFGMKAIPRNFWNERKSHASRKRSAREAKKVLLRHQRNLVPTISFE
jgi:hypothetical protein